MGIMALRTFADSNRTVHELLLERDAVMALQAEFCSVLTDVQQITARGSMRLVTRNTVAFLERCMPVFLLSFWVMALITECRYLGRQFKALFILYGVRLLFLLVTCKAVIVFYRGVQFLQGDNWPVTDVNRTRFSGDVNRG